MARAATFVNPALLAACAVLLAGCASPRLAARLPPTAALTEAPADGSADWRPLLLAPLGTLLKDMPRGLHEVLLFHEVPGDAPSEDGGALECFAPDAPPRFLDRALQRYLLCFSRDRLARVEAAVRLPAARAAGLLVRVCAEWGAGPEAEGCRGEEGAIKFEARLQAEADPGQSLLALALTPVMPEDATP